MNPIKNYTNESSEQILIRTQELTGKRIVDIVPRSKEINLKNKGQIGNFIQEYWFGIKPNNDENPDFSKSEIELKVIPLIKPKRSDSSNQYLIKERTKICSINYQKIIYENWETSHAKKKLNKLLFVFYLWDTETPMNSVVIDYLLYHVDSNIFDKEIIKTDWSIVKDYIIQKRAEQISERLFNYLSASTSGSGLLKQIPNTNIKIKERSFSLKQSYTKVIFNEKRGIKYDSILDISNLNSLSKLEEHVLYKLSIVKGMSISEIAYKYEIPLKASLDRFAILIRKLLGLDINKKNKIKEFEKFNIHQKVIRVNSTSMLPYQSISFKHQNMESILNENDFEESELFGNIEKILFIILKSDNDKDSNDRIIIHDFFFWSPNVQELNKIEKEYDTYRETIRNGIVVTKKAVKNKKGFVYTNNLPGLKETECIHMRPHGSNNSDLDISIPNTPIPKQCFWLNKKFIQNIILKQNA